MTGQRACALVLVGDAEEDSDEEASGSEDDDEGTGTDEGSEESDGNDLEDEDEADDEEQEHEEAAQEQSLQRPDEDMERHSQDVDSRRAAATSESAGGAAAGKLPFTLEAPSSYEAFAQLVAGRPAEELSLAIQRIRICNALALASGNRKKMQVTASLAILNCRVLPFLGGGQHACCCMSFFTSLELSIRQLCLSIWLQVTECVGRFRPLHLPDGFPFWSRCSMGSWCSILPCWQVRCHCPWSTWMR